jgi:hypothetical protein
MDMGWDQDGWHCTQCWLCACNMWRYVHDGDDLRSILTAEIKLMNSRY